jgi:hypothetical protein
VPTDVEHFSTRSKTKRKAPRRPRPNGEAAHQGRTPQPGVPTGPRNAPKARRRNRAVAKSLDVAPLKTPSRADLAAREARQRKAAAIAKLLRAGGPSRLEQAATPPKVATATARNPENRPGFAPSKADAFAAPALADLEKLHAEGKIGKSLGLKIYEKIAEGGTYILPEGAELKAGAEGLSVAIRGATAGDLQVGGSRLLSKVLKPVEVSSSEGRAALTERAAEKAAAKEATGVKAAATRAARKVTRADSKADAAVARQAAGKATRKQAVAAAGAPLKLTKATAAQTLPVVQGHEKAIVENPGKVAQTTARAIPGLVTAPVGQAIGLGITGGRAVSEGAHELGIPGARGYTGKQILEPAKNIGEEQLAFARQVAKTLTSDDSAEVQKEVEDNLGLMLPVMLGLVGKATREKITDKSLTTATRKIVENARSAAGRSKGTHNGQAPRVFEDQAQRKRESVRVARAKSRSHIEGHARTKDIRREAGRVKGKETIRKGVGVRGRITGRRGDLTVHSGDVAPLAVRHSLPLDKPVEALADVKRIRRELTDLPEGMVLPAGQISTRDLLEAIERNPHWLSDKHLAEEVAAARAQARHAREHAAELEPEHSEVARFTPTAIARKAPLASERYPQSVRDIVRAPAGTGVAKDILKREARSDRQRSRRQSRKAATREARGRAIAAELRVRERAEPNWVKRNAAVAAKGERLANQARVYRSAASRAAEDAIRKSHAAVEHDPSIEPEFVEEMRQRLADEGRPEPEYTHTGRVKGISTSGTAAVSMVRFGSRSKRRAGSAERMGIVAEGLGPYLKDSIAKPISNRESFKAIRSFHDDNDLVIDGKRDFTPDEVQRLVDEGKVDTRRYVAIPPPEFKRAYEPADYAEQLARSIKDGDPSAKRVRLVRRPAADEFAAQLSNAAVFKPLARINRATSYLILGTSPAWAAAQIVAEYAQGASAQPKLLNPAWVAKAIKAYRALPDEKRWAFDSWAGVTARDLEAPGHLAFDSVTGDPSSAGSAWSVMNRTFLGRAIKSIPKTLQRIDQWKGGGIRVLTAAAKIDGDLAKRGGAFLRGIRGLSDEMQAATKQMKGKSLDEQIAWIGDHPEFERHYADYLDDVMGNWSALTKNERLASQIAIFYPFMRMSLRWTFYAFPKRHPIKAAMLGYLAQQNAVTLKKFLGNDPGYFSEWANVPVKLGPGETDVIPLTRVGVGSNTLVEVAGEDVGLKGVGLKMAQPAVAALIQAETGVNPFTGKEEESSAVGAASQLWSLPAPVRIADELTVPDGKKRAELAPPIFGNTERQVALDKLFDKLDEAHTGAKAARTLAVPVLPKKGAAVRDMGRLRLILKQLEENSSTRQKEAKVAWAYEGKGGNKRQIDRTLTAMEAKKERANAALDKLYDKYGIDYETEEAAGDQRFDEIEYGSQPKTGTTIGGSQVQAPPGESQGSRTGGHTTIGGVVVGSARQEPKEPRFGRKTRKQTTIGGVPVG